MRVTVLPEWSWCCVRLIQEKANVYLLQWSGKCAKDQKACGRMSSITVTCWWLKAQASDQKSRGGRRQVCTLGFLDRRRLEFWIERRDEEESGIQRLELLSVWISLCIRASLLSITRTLQHDARAIRPKNLALWSRAQMLIISQTASLGCLHISRVFPYELSGKLISSDTAPVPFSASSSSPDVQLQRRMMEIFSGIICMASIHSDLEYIKVAFAHGQCLDHCLLRACCPDGESLGRCPDD